jgi:hypothetical protein
VWSIKSFKLQDTYSRLLFKRSIASLFAGSIRGVFFQRFLGYMHTYIVHSFNTDRSSDPAFRFFSPPSKASFSFSSTIAFFATIDRDLANQSPLWNMANLWLEGTVGPTRPS